MKQVAKGKEPEYRLLQLALCLNIKMAEKEAHGLSPNANILLPQMVDRHLIRRRTDTAGNVYYVIPYSQSTLEQELELEAFFKRPQ